MAYAAIGHRQWRRADHQPDHNRIRTADEYSNVSSRERLRQTATGQWPAPMTANDLAARSSHRGDHPITVVCADLNLLHVSETL